MPEVEVSEVVERPIEEVFAYLEDPSNELEWQSMAREREVEGPIEKGAHFKSVEGFLGRRVDCGWEITEHDPVTRLSARTLSGSSFQGEYSFDLRPVDGGTKVTFHTKAEAGFRGVFGKLTDPVITRVFRRDAQSDLGKLKDILEARA